MRIPDNEPYFQVTLRCDGCGGAAYWDGGITPEKPGAWRHQEMADALFCNILETAVNMAQG